MKRFLLASFLAGAVALAGCADNASNAMDDGASQLPAMSGEQAEELVQQALASLPEQYGFHMVASKNGRDLVTADGTFDNATGTSYLTLRGDRSLFAGFETFADGVSVYASRDGAVYQLAGIVVVQGAMGDELSGFLPTELVSPEMFLEELGADLTVESARATSWNGAPAVEIAFRVVEGEQTVDGKITATQNPSRIVRLEGSLPEEAQAGPMSGATMQVDLLYGSDAPSVPAEIDRYLQLGYTIEATSGDTATWTFQGDGVALSELHVRVQDAASGAPADASPAVQMALSDGSASSAGVTLTFTDADGDATLSAGDTLAIDASGADFEPRVLLFDTVTGKHVTSDLFVVMSSMFGGF